MNRITGIYHCQTILLAMVALMVAPAAYGTVIFVETLQDNMIVNYQTSLREAIEAAVTNTSVDGCPAGGASDTIYFHAALDGGTIMLQDGMLRVTGGGDLLISASTLPNRLNIDAQGSSRILKVDHPDHLQLSHLNFPGGTSTLSGGAIFCANGSMELDHVLIYGNGAANHGGGIATADDLTMTWCTIRDNGSGGNGGGICALSQPNVSLTNCLVRDNRAGWPLADCDGGGIHYEGGAGTSLTVTDSRVVGNRAHDGGGLFISGGSATFTDAHIDSNSVEPVTYIILSNGGGINGSNADLTLLRTSINHNRALHNGSVDSWGNGGGLMVSGTAELTECEIHGNSVSARGPLEEGYGAGLYCWHAAEVFIWDSVITGNTGGNGAGLVNRGDMTVTRCQILDNHTSFSGGGVYCWEHFDSAFARLTLDSCTIDGNTGNSGAGIGNTGICDVIDCVVSNNVATGEGGGIESEGDMAHMTITRGTIHDNIAGTDGGGISNYYGDLTITGGSIEGNNAGADGGGIHNDWAPLHMTDVIVLDNQADNGAGLFNTSTVMNWLLIERCTFNDNVAATDGGGLYILGYADLDQVTISRNGAQFGGGLHHGDGDPSNNRTATLRQCTVSGNTATLQGGGMLVLAPLEIGGTIVSANTSSGGRIDVDNNRPGFTGEPLTSLGYNLIGDTNVDTWDATDQVGVVDPRLAPLRDNGGFTATMALLFGSPAIDASDPALCGSFTCDGRGDGFLRGIDGDGDGTATCDIGAYETQPLGFGIAITAEDDPVWRRFPIFTGDGFTDEPVSGQLDSDKVIVRGLGSETSPMDFGETRLSVDYACGQSTVGGGFNGVYAYEIGGNSAFGWQPGDDCFTPGAIFIGYQNLTGVPITTISIEHDVYSYNCGDRANRVWVACATDSGCATDPSDLTFTNIAGSGYVSPAAADASPVWIKTPYSLVVSNLSIPDQGAFYLCFATDDASGSGYRDAFALDNVKVVANPSSISDVDLPDLEFRDGHLLGDVFPNPFNPTTAISLAVQKPQQVQIEVFDLAGRRVRILFDGHLAAGESRQFTLDGRDLASGAYLFTVNGEFFSAIRKGMLVK